MDGLPGIDLEANAVKQSVVCTQCEAQAGENSLVNLAGRGLDLFWTYFNAN